MDSIISYFLICWQNSFNYKGRARRLEIGAFLLLTIIIAAGLQITELFIKEYIYSYSDLLHFNLVYTHVENGYLIKQPYFTFHMITCCYLLVSIAPLLSVTARRLQDLNKSKYWIFYLFHPFFIILILFIRLSIFIYFETDILGITWLDEHWVYVISPFLLYEIFLILKILFQEGEPDENQYGQSPKY
ncbi:DUF805 domain-containing protein [Aggregatibacter kilianii]|uniref:DUF805 domain-containing protein n=1 Tax=Aggregatibacter kilianii TaxID=2025884 RepID=UPI000D655407|nr:DUF805 domain-containing protein [Aggregatibacter kilianii]